MQFTLRYQVLIDQESLTVPCPDEIVSTITRPSYRWCNSPVNHQHNFFPNRFVDQLKGKARRKLKGDKDCCEYCAISFFDTLDNAKDRFMGFPDRIREMLGYTHVAHGVVEDTDGLTSEPDEYGHFNFFEFDNLTVQLQDKFIIVHSFSNGII